LIDEVQKTWSGFYGVRCRRLGNGGVLP
jgi:hypothetical protein